mmetsp:Transcript_7831/g.8993  ORF Transcript_7831/g.8993 Transcript_7831/m.8993 type:complete len:115 (-) Transcript_7831:280-624(-)
MPLRFALLGRTHGPSIRFGFTLSHQRIVQQDRALDTETQYKRKKGGTFRLCLLLHCQQHHQRTQELTGSEGDKEVAPQEGSLADVTEQHGELGGRQRHDLHALNFGKGLLAVDE